MDYSSPIKLSCARAWRTYTGGSQIDRIHGILDSKDTQFPEEWIMSTVLARNAGREDIEEGMCYLDGQGDISLKAYIENDCEKSLGKAHLQDVGKSLGVLVKIIDAAERLTVQVHPNKDQARRLFNSAFGKTECWHILGGRVIDNQEPSIYMGFKEGITRQEWKSLFDSQDTSAMLEHMHHIKVKPGQTFLIKGGVPHAIGQGCLLVEIQEPTDYTIRIERVTPKGLKVDDKSCHQGLGFEAMFDCFDYDGCSEEEALRKWCIEPSTLEKTPDYRIQEIIGYRSTDCFRLLKYEINGECKMDPTESFSGLYVLQGHGELDNTPIAPADQFFIPNSSKSFVIKASKGQSLSVLRFFGPKLNGTT